MLWAPSGRQLSLPSFLFSTGYSYVLPRASPRAAADPRSDLQASPSSAHSIPRPTTGAFESFNAPEPSFSLLLPGAALLALALIVVDPLLSRALLAHYPAARQISSGWPIALSSTLFVGYVGFGRGTSLAEILVGGVAWTGELLLLSALGKV